MTESNNLQSLENLLESFLGKVVELKEKRLSVLEGINSLDDISRLSSRGIDITDEMGEWFADHNRWLTDRSFKQADLEKIDEMLSQIKNEIKIDQNTAPAKVKIDKEITRWSDTVKESSSKIVLKRSPESTEEATDMYEKDTISLFFNELETVNNLFKDYSANKQHILSVLDDLLKSASIQLNKDALILSAFIIYYLKLNGYKTEPFVKKLKEAETILAKGALDAHKR